MPYELTPFQERLLAYILGYYADNGYSPTCEEMAQAMNRRRKKQVSKGAVYHHSEMLVKAGRLKRTMARWRNLKPVSA